MSNIDGVFQSQWKQYLAGMAATLAMVNVGTEEYWLLETFKNVLKLVHESKARQYLILAGFFIAACSSVFGAILGALLADRFGRRRILLTTSILTMVQIIGGSSTHAVFSCVSLVLGEIGVGIIQVVVPLYVSEIADDKIRGALLMLQLPYFYFGKLIVVGLGDMVSKEIFSGVLIIVTIIFIATFTCFPETPYYLATKKKDFAEAESLAFYRGMKKITMDDEIQMIIKNVESPRNPNQGCCGRIRDLARPSNRKGLLILLFLIVAKWSEQRFDIHNDFVHVMINTYISSHQHARIIAYLISLIASILMVFTIDKIGRRSYLLYSTSVAFVLIIFILSLKQSVQLHKWVYEGIAIILHFCKLIIFSVPLVYVGEFFSANVRAIAIAIVTTFNLVIGIVIIALCETAEMDPSFYCAGILLLFAFPIALAFFPETKQKSLSDIQRELRITFHCRWLRNRFIRSHATQ